MGDKRQLPLPMAIEDPAPVFEHPHVAFKDGMWRIEGTRVPAQRPYSWHKRGITIETLFKRYPQIPRAHLLSAIAFLYDNPNLFREDSDT